MIIGIAVVAILTLGALKVFRGIVSIEVYTLNALPTFCYAVSATIAANVFFSFDIEISHFSVSFCLHDKRARLDGEFGSRIAKRPPEVGRGGADFLIKTGKSLAENWGNRASLGRRKRRV